MLERAAVVEKTEVGQRAGRQQPTQQVEGLGPCRGLPRAVGLTGFEREAVSDGLGDRLDQAAVGREKRVGGGLVLRVSQLSAAVRQGAAAGTPPVKPGAPRRPL